MIIWVDADSCPKQVRDLICKTGLRLHIPVSFVANRPIPMPAAPGFSMIQAGSEPDAADDYIVSHAGDNDLVITRDIPLAKRLVDKKLVVLNDRGIVYTENNINERLSIRNLMLDLYNNGIAPEKTGQFGKKELQNFANALDREITKKENSLNLQCRETARV
ncbi:DUF188 domain-containing protein [Brucepastera parasyntrophica]|uniref:YaiI/YqxD family protein n=1 Tax=Brucepastera parasyntrophica TaxID=2880008 RepID=UPI00210BC080|nr:DUF188 domain-containing protein [Brucepastera parasyntrophica]ULQ61115.1 DUF188 domain-containing protein [Brucepastera parasyntrophica]